MNDAPASLPPGAGHGSLIPAIASGTVGKAAFLEQAAKLEIQCGSDYLRIRQSADRFVSIVLLLFSAPLLLIMALVVLLTSRGPAIYRQRRVGFHGKIFTIYKIRTMRRDAERGTGAVWCTQGDPRVTPIGCLLRRSHLDELPQLFNVARGEMALIGPRPERPEIVARLSEQIPGYTDRLEALPGITGLAQVVLPPDSDLAGVRQKVRMDDEYIRAANPVLDGWIVWRTVGVSLFAGSNRPKAGEPGAAVAG